MSIKGFGNSAVGTFTDFFYFLKTFSWLVDRHKVNQVKNIKKIIGFFSQILFRASILGCQ